MIGSIIGDIAGSIHEFTGNRDPHVDLFPPESEATDDSILTLATCEAILTGRDYGEVYREFGRMYPDPMGGYGLRFHDWLHSDDPAPYGSWGNGSAMRVGPVGYAFDDVDEVLRQAHRSAAVTHDHPEGIKGAQATALAVLLARQGVGKEGIRTAISGRFGYDLGRTVESIRATYTFQDSCQHTVPEALIAVLDANSFEEAIRNAISLGGDADTLGCIAGGVAQALFRDVPTMWCAIALDQLPAHLLDVAERFCFRYTQAAGIFPGT